MRMLLGLSEALPSLVEAKYKAAKASHSVIFSPTELAVIRSSTGVPFQLRYCPSLAKKSQPLKEETSKTTAKKPRIDPFANPEPELLIANVPASSPTHFLVLNKFPIIENHFIVATKENKAQTHRLEEDDLAVTYACLKEWHESGGRRLFAFFNSGQHSGASQPHRHLQLLPVDDMHDGEKSKGWDLLIDSMLSGEEVRSTDSMKVVQSPDLPFSHFAHAFTSEPSGSQLLEIYSCLYKQAEEAVDEFIASHPGQMTLHETTDGDVPISYNLAMTTEGMAILPRRSEGLGQVQLNGTALGGTLMVKYEEEWEVLRAQPQKLDDVLESIGIPRSGQRTKL